jgi:hypothetical protein
MATLSNGSYTLSDWAKSLDPNGAPARMINLLSQKNEIVENIPFMEGNLPVGHQTTALTGLPEVAYRMIGAGVVPSKETTAQYMEQCGMAETWSQVDKDLALLAGSVGAFRAQKAGPRIEAMAQSFANRLFYGNTGTDPAAFTGLAPRYSSLSAGNAQNIIDAGGSQSDNTSIWYIRFHEETVTGIFPKGSSAGMLHEDKGEQIEQNANGVTGAKRCDLVDRWQWKHGLCVADWRYAVRICNIDISSLQAESGADLIELMEEAEELVPTEIGKGGWCMNRTMIRFLRKITREDVAGGGGLTYENVDGKRRRFFGESPVWKCDQLVNTEARVV